MESLLLDAPALIRRQFALEGIGLDADERLVRVPGGAAEEIPRLYVARHAGGYARFFRRDLPDDVVAWLEALPAEAALSEPDRVKQVLALDGPLAGTWAGTSYAVERPPDPAIYPDVSVLTAAQGELTGRFDPDVLNRGPVYAVLLDGQIVSACVSARENAEAAEAWVQTVPAYRGRGYARQTTAAWAGSVLSRGKIAFYSHLWTNLASKRVALSLGLVPFIDAVGFL
ncbi:MAG TPA: GNAT family N-acetyltransferase [Chloroflexota bacterium]